MKKKLLFATLFLALLGGLLFPFSGSISAAPGSKYRGQIENLNHSVCSSVSFGAAFAAQQNVECTHRYFASVASRIHVPNYMLAGPYPEFPIVSVPTTIGYKVEPLGSFTVIQSSNNARIGSDANEDMERFVNYKLHLMMVAGETSIYNGPSSVAQFNAGDVNCYGNVCYLNNDANRLFVLQTSGNTYAAGPWDQAIFSTLEGFRKSGYSNITDKPIRTHDDLMNRFFPGGKMRPDPYIINNPATGQVMYDILYAPNYFIGLYSMTSSKGGSYGGDKFSIEMPQEWTVLAKQEWDSIQWHKPIWEEVCDPPGPPAYPGGPTPEPENCEDEIVDWEWETVDSSHVETQWYSIGTVKRWAVDGSMVTDMEGFGNKIPLAYYQSQPLLTDQ